MLWTAPPRARECQRGGGCLELPRFGGATHASDYDKRINKKKPRNLRGLVNLENVAAISDSRIQRQADAESLLPRRALSSL
jgi:hypothetical protein